MNRAGYTTGADVFDLIGTGDLFLAARVRRGPSQDSPQFRPVTRAAAGHGPIDTLLGDGAFDAEHNHAHARERLGIRSTVIPL